MERSANEVVRCGNCGHQQPANAAFIGPLSQCERCETNLHSCKHCKHFESSARFQCRKPVKEPVASKWAANECPLFEPRLVLDSTGKRLNGKKKTEAKNAFDALFKD